MVASSRSGLEGFVESAVASVGHTVQNFVTNGAGAVWNTLRGDFSQSFDHLWVGFKNEIRGLLHPWLHLVPGYEPSPFVLERAKPAVAQSPLSVSYRSPAFAQSRFSQPSWSVAA